MRFVDDEFLLLSRGGRVSSGTNQLFGPSQSEVEPVKPEPVVRTTARRRRWRRTRGKGAKALAGLVVPVGRGRTHYAQKR
jgi:hypothetical protein